MKIAVDFTYTPSGGSATQIINIIRYLSAYCKGSEIIFYTKRSNLHVFDNVDHSGILYLSRLSELGVLGRVLWGQVMLPFLVKRHHVDALFCPGNIAPVFSTVKTIQWIGTIGPFWNEYYELNVSILKKLRFMANKELMYFSARKSDVVIFESEYTRALFIDQYSVCEASTRVIRTGRDKFFYPKKARNHSFDVNGETIMNPFILCVSHLYEYKNYIRLIEAFSVAKNELTKNIRLVVAGEIVSQAYFEEIQRAMVKYGCDSDIIFLGLVSKEQLRVLYSSCDIMVFPCPVENFAYTLVEAMSCGAPIITANTTAMPETCGDAALYFDPNDAYELATLLIKLMKDKELQDDLRAKAFKRVSELPDYEEVNKITAMMIADMVK